MGRTKRHYSTSSSTSSSEDEDARIIRLEREIKKLKKKRSHRRYRSPSQSTWSPDVSPPRPQGREEHTRGGLSRNQQLNDIEYIMVPEEAGELNPDQLDASILGILGYQQIPQKKTSPKIHQTIARQWGDILKLGLPDNKVTEMVDKYPPIENCPWVEAPKCSE